MVFVSAQDKEVIGLAADLHPLRVSDYCRCLLFHFCRLIIRGEDEAGPLTYDAGSSDAWFGSIWIKLMGGFISTSLIDILCRSGVDLEEASSSLIFQDFLDPHPDWQQ
jgi:hypothetical protein